jgi:hypothetical protein
MYVLEGGGIPPLLGDDGDCCQTPDPVFDVTTPGYYHEILFVPSFIKSCLCLKYCKLLIVVMACAVIAVFFSAVISCHKK